MSRMQQLEAHEVALNKVFSSDYDFRIPEYQRPYAWQVEQSVQLLDDLVEAMDRSGAEPYFLGSVVLVKTRDTATAEVIDGQQRLTTLTILLATMRDLSEDADIAAELGEMLQERGRRLMGIAAKPRLALRDRDQQFFNEYIQQPGGTLRLSDVKPESLRTDAQRAVRGNALALREKIAEWTERRRIDLMQMLAARTFLVVVGTPDLASAHRIFSVMNARGLDLSAADIFKAKVVGDVPEQDRDEYADRWDDVEESLGTDDFADLFLHIRTIVSKERARRELLKEFEEQVLNGYLPGSGAVFVDEVVEPYARAYGVLRDRSFTAASGADEVNRWLKRMSLLDNNDWRPPALWVLKNHGEDPAFLDKFFRALERIAASMLIRRVYTTPRATRYVQLLRELGDGRGLESPAFALTSQERGETVDRLNGNIYGSAPVRKYVLLRLDELLAEASGVVYDHPRISVEHVLPQNPKRGSEWEALFSPDEQQYWTHRLANLVLLNRTKNSAAGNYDFDRKKRQYFSAKHGVATFAVTSQVLRETAWTPGLLEKRQAELVGLLATEWRL